LLVVDRLSEIDGSAPGPTHSANRRSGALADRGSGALIYSVPHSQANLDIKEVEAYAAR
jgi:hypothetical protein